MSRLDELLAPLLDAVEDATFPLRGDGEGWRPRAQAALAAALRLVKRATRDVKVGRA